MDYLVLLTYLSAQLFFQIKPFAGLYYVLLNYSELDHTMHIVWSLLFC